MPGRLPPSSTTRARSQPGAAFVAVRGEKADGADFVPQALARGAALVVAERPPAGEGEVPWVQVRDGRLALALLGAEVAGQPSREIPVVGVTGTNGKTTTTYLLAAVLDAAGQSAGVLGTVHYKVGGEEREAARTTPEAPDVQALLREMIQRGNRACVMEVSSHALALKRVDGTRFAAAVFTNLTRDHLDFHADMEAYFAAKRRLFEMLPPESPGVINADDARAPALVAACARPLTYGIQKPADVRPEGLSMDLSGVRFTAATPSGPVPIRSSLVGRPNVYNLLAASAAACALGLPATAIAGGLSALRGGARPLRSGVGAERRGDRRRRLRPHRRRAAQPARDGAAADPRPDRHRVRVRRRPRPHQAAVDGDGRGAAERRGGDHLRQPAQRGARGDHRRDQARHPGRRGGGLGPRARRDDGGRPRRGDRPRRRPPHGRATWCWWPARVTRRHSTSAANVLPFDDAEVSRAALVRRRGRRVS